MTDSGVTRAVLAAALLMGGATVAGAAEDEQDLTIEFSAPPAVTVNEIEGGEEQFFGTHGGVVDAESPSPLAGAEVTCEFDGYTFPARSFSCGFTTAEAVAGRCLFTTPEGDTAVAEWQCETAATMTSDARCEGRATWIEGTGKFAGIQGKARFHTDLFLHPSEGYARWRGSWGVPRMAALTD